MVAWHMLDYYSAVNLSLKVQAKIDLVSENAIPSWYNIALQIRLGY